MGVEVTMAKDNDLGHFLLTKHVLLNSATLTALIDFKEHIQANDKRLYNALRQNIVKLIKEQQAIHDIYKKIIPKTDFVFWKMLDEINENIDKTLLK